MVKGELITLGTAAAAIGGAYKFSEFLHKAKRLRDVGPANAVYVRIIGRVRSDLDEVKRLLSVREVHDALEGNPEKSKWVYGVMRDVRGALENITPHTERVGGDVEEGRRVGLRHRIYWLVSEQEKLENREKELVVAHASLSEVLGYLTTLEPVEEPRRPKSSSKKDTHVDVDIEVKREGPQHTTERIERDVYVEQDSAPTRRIEEQRDVWIERDRQDHHHHHRLGHLGHHLSHLGHHHGHHDRHDRHDRHGPSQAHIEEHREVYIDERERGPQRYEERDIHIERTRESREPREPREPRGARYEADYDERYEEFEHVERRPQYPKYPEERDPEEMYPEDRRRDERSFREPPTRRPESFEDRLPERDSWMQSAARNGTRQSQFGPYGEYAEYGAPQPVGAAHYKRRFQGDAGFGDEEILNPQPVPLDRKYAEREMWIEQKEDYRYDEYGNKLPDRFFQPPVPRPYRSRM